MAYSGAGFKPSVPIVPARSVAGFGRGRTVRPAPGQLVRHLSRQFLRLRRRAGLVHRRRNLRVADCPADPHAAVRSGCPASAAESRAARSASHRDLAVVADLRPRTGHGSGRHLHIGDDRARRIPEFGVIGRDLQHADVGIIGAVPPGLGRRREQLLDLGAVVGDSGGAGERDIFLVAGIGEREIDGRIAGDLLILVTRASVRK